MYFEQEIVKDVPNLPSDHKYYWLEDLLKSAASGLGLNKKHLHDEEHKRQLIHWGCKPEHTSKLTIRKDEEGNYFADRLYHCMLHLKFWKETNEQGARKEAYERFEAESGFNLDDLTLPEPSAQGESVY